MLERARNAPRGLGALGLVQAVRAWRGGGDMALTLLWGLALWVAALALLPIAYLFVRAAGAGVVAWRFLLRPRTLEVLLRSLALAAAVSGAAALIAMPLAWLTTRTDLSYRRVWFVLAVLPLVVPSYVGGLVWVSAFGPRGMLQQLLGRLLGVERLLEIYGFPGAVLALTLFSYPYLLLATRSGLLGLDPALEEASRSLGHGPWRTFWRITLPQLRPAVASGVLLVALYVLSDFGAVSLLQFDTFTRAIYLQYMASFDRSAAALLALLLVGLSLAIVAAERCTRSGGRYCRSTAGVVRPVPITPLGRWQWPALGFCAGVVLLALALPITVLGYWLGRGLAEGGATTGMRMALWNSVYVSGLTALAATVAALPVVILAVRWPSRVSGAIERAAYVGFALPGIVIALALVFFGAHYARPLYQTLVLLVLAYVVRFLPQAVGPLRASLLQVRPSLEDAARSLGRTRAHAFATITVPLMRPGLIAGVVMVLLTTMKELPITLLLSPIGFRTLATEVWTATAEGFFAQAAAPALFLVLASGLSIVPMIQSEGVSCGV